MEKAFGILLFVVIQLQTNPGRPKTDTASNARVVENLV
jgi:hypothetical protein